MFETKEIDELCEKLFAVRARYDEADKVRKEIGSECDKLEAQIIDTLEKAEKDSWDSKSCKVSVTHKTSVKVPKDLEAKLKLFDYLKGKGMFEEMVGVNSMTLNAFYKEQFEQEIEKGNVAWEMPGVGSPTMTKGLQVRKK